MVCIICDGELKKHQKKTCSIRCRGMAHSLHQRGENNPQWKGGKFDEDGYVSVYAPDHPSASQRRMFEHRLIMENAIGRYLRQEEVVHHRNGNRNDNRIENLELLTRREHSLRHYIEDWKMKGLAPQQKISDKQAIRIRERYARGERQVGLAEEFGVRQNTISFIVLGQGKYASFGEPIRRCMSCVKRYIVPCVHTWGR